MMKRVLLLAGIVGCASHVDGGGGDVPPGSSGWAIDVDMSGLDRFVPLGTTTWPVRGHVKASAAIAEVDVAGMPAQLDAGDFSAMVTTAPGLTLVPIVATDIDAHARQANRSLLEARFAPEGSANPGGASIVFTDAILAAMSSGLAGNVAAVDVAGEILAMPVLSDDGQCATWPTSASQGQVAAHLYAITRSCGSRSSCRSWTSRSTASARDHCARSRSPARCRATSRSGRG